MKVVVNEAVLLKKISTKKNIPFANLLQAYMMEDFVCRIFSSPYSESFLLKKESFLSEQSYEGGFDGRIELFYQESDRKFLGEKLVPGQKMSLLLLKAIEEQCFLEDNPYEIHWLAMGEESEGSFCISLIGEYMDMTVPLKVCIYPIPVDSKTFVKKSYVSIFTKKELTYFSYSPEHILTEKFFEIMKKLELIPNMEAYAVVDEILRTESISGRHVMEILEALSKQEPKVAKQKRIEQIEAYRDYAYMRKRWEQYEKNHNLSPRSWTDVLDRFMEFAKPLWECLCRNEILFDDWMPELGRFLG